MNLVYEDHIRYGGDAAAACAASLCHCAACCWRWRGTAQRRSWWQKKGAASFEREQRYIFSTSARRKLAVTAPVAAAKRLPVSASLNRNSVSQFIIWLVVCICTPCIAPKDGCASALHACRPMYRRVFRMVGRDIVRKRLAVEAGWHSWITQVTAGGG